MKRPATALAALAFAACSRDARLYLGPEMTDGMASALIVLTEPSGSRVFASATDRPANVDTTAGHEALLITALTFRRSLAELGLEAGEVALAVNGPPMPAADRTFAADATGEASPSFVAVETPDARVRNLLLKARTPSDCLGAGGCYPRVDSAGYQGCVIPCAEPPVPAAPMPPEAPSLLPCPEAWIERTDGALTVCDPYSATRTCGPGLGIHEAGGVCRALGTSCAGFAPDLPSGHTILYVDAAAAPGGDGSVLAPYDDLAVAATVAPPSSIIALAPGDYVVAIAIGDGVELWGACTSGTRVRSPDDRPAIAARTGRAVVRNLSVDGGQQAVSVHGATAELSLFDVFAGPRTGLVWVFEGKLTAEYLLLDGPTLQVGTLGEARLTHVETRVASNFGFTVVGGRLHIDDLYLDHIGYGVTMNGGHLVLERTVAVDVNVVAQIAGPTSTASISDLVVSDSRTATTTYTYVLSLEQANVSARRVRIEGPRLPVSFSAQANASLDLEDALIRGSGRMAVYTDEASIDLRRVAIEAAGGFAAIEMHGGSGRARLEDIRIDNILASSGDTPTGRGMLFDGGDIRMHRVAITRATYTGVRVEVGASVTGSDLSISDTRPDPRLGRGLEIDGNAGFVLDRLRVIDSSNTSVFVANTSSVELRDVEITRVTPSSCIGSFCATSYAEGIVVSISSNATIDRFLVTQAAGAAVSLERGSSLILRNGRIADSAVAIRLSDPDVPVAPLAEGVVLSGNTENFGR